MRGTRRSWWFESLDDAGVTHLVRRRRAGAVQMEGSIRGIGPRRLQQGGGERHWSCGKQIFFADIFFTMTVPLNERLTTNAFPE
jgi:hypothetical protein